MKHNYFLYGHSNFMLTTSTVHLWKLTMVETKPSKSSSDSRLLGRVVRVNLWNIFIDCNIIQLLTCNVWGHYTCKRWLGCLNIFSFSLSCWSRTEYCHILCVTEKTLSQLRTSSVSCLFSSYLAAPSSTVFVQYIHYPYPAHVQTISTLPLHTFLNLFALVSPIRNI